ncbi:MAG TPA: PEP-CTERM sorting domain-containing protein, partial [Gemmataceae bacterium]|nr:PEP-CTERM sorting domain-containing protein [Gemmataceae bacterium]
RLDQTFQIHNPNSAPLSISLFNFAAWSPGGHTAGLNASGDINAIAFTDGVYNDTHTAVGATAYQAATDLTLVNLLYGGAATDLNDTGLPIVNYAAHPDLPNDAFEWTLTIAGNGSATVEADLVTARAVPEPASFLLAGVGGALALWQGRRCQRRRSVSRAPTE